MRWVVLALLLVACRDKEAAPPPAPAPQPVGTAPTAPTTPRPALPAIDAALDPNLTVAQAFAAETVEPQWRMSTSQMVRDRLIKAPGRVPDIDCRRTICQVTITGNAAEMSRAIDVIQQLHDVARVVLSRDGDKVRAYLQFDR